MASQAFDHALSVLVAVFIATPPPHTHTHRHTLPVQSSGLVLLHQPLASLTDVSVPQPPEAWKEIKYQRQIKASFKQFVYFALRFSCFVLSSSPPTKTLRYQRTKSMCVAPFLHLRDALNGAFVFVF